MKRTDEVNVTRPDPSYPVKSIESLEVVEGWKG